MVRPLTFSVGIAAFLGALACGPKSHNGASDEGGPSGGDSTSGGGTAGTATGGVSGASAGGASGASGTTSAGGTIVVGGSGGSSTVPPPDSDDDGIPDDDEITGGTDPNSPDSDGDGCDDLTETTFGDCNESIAGIYACDGELSVILTMGIGTGERMSDLTTEIVPLAAGYAEDLWPTVTDITPPDAGGLVEGPSLSSVDPGARVSYRVVPYVVFRWTGVRTYTLRVSSAAGGVLAEGKLLWRRGYCPYIG